MAIYNPKLVDAVRQAARKVCRTGSETTRRNRPASSSQIALCAGSMTACCRGAIVAPMFGLGGKNLGDVDSTACAKADDSELGISKSCSGRDLLQCGVPGG